MGQKTMSAAELYGRMALIRHFEQAAYRAYERSELEGTIHASIGQEAVAVGVAAGLRDGDRMLSHHRGHGHALAKGVDPGRLMAELFGRVDGVCAGKGGSMHVSDVNRGFLGSLAVVGSSVPLAVGAALAARRADEDGVCVVFFGDGAVNQGVVYESMNLAVIWGLAVLFVCEHNSYAITTPAEQVTAGSGIQARAKAFGLGAQRVDGQDVEAVADATRTLAAQARAGRPALLECLTYRFLGHSRSDPAHGHYRGREEVARWQERDPLAVLAHKHASLDVETRARLDADAQARVAQALELARASPRPGLRDLEADVWGCARSTAAQPPAAGAAAREGAVRGETVRGAAGPEGTVREGTVREETLREGTVRDAPVRGAATGETFAEAIRRALEDSMAEDETIVLLGQDIAAGFPFGATRGLVDLYGSERVRDTPISEAATMGCGIGAAMMGARAVVEVDFAGFLLLGFDQLVNNAAKLRYMSGGQLRVPLVVRAGQGPLGAFAAQHSQSQQAWLASVPGLALCAPADPPDAYELMRWALVQRDPVVFAEDMRLYRHKGLSPGGPSGGLPGGPPGGPWGGLPGGLSGGLPGGPSGAGTHDEDTPRARVLRPGRDATAVCYGFGTSIALAAAAELVAHGIELEVLDLRLLSPLDEAAIGDSARHTGRVLCVGDDPLLGGITATLAAVVQEQAHGELSAPVARLGARRMPTPFGSSEACVYPSADSVLRAIRGLLAWPRTEDLEIADGELRMVRMAPR